MPYIPEMDMGVKGCNSIYVRC